MTKKVSASLQAKLRKAREKFSKAEPAQNNSVANRKVPDGTYQAKVVGIDFAEFGKKAVLKFTYEITDSDKKSHESAIGELVETRYGLETDEGPGFIKRDFEKYGYDEVDDLLDDIDEANALFLELVGMNPIVKIAVAMDSTDQFQNVYLNDVLELDEPEESEEEEPPKKKGKNGNSKTKKSKVKEKEDEPEDTADDDDAKESEEAEEEESEDDESDGESDIEVGDIVEVDYKGKEVVGEVIGLDEENETVKVQLKKPKKRIIVPIEKVFILEG